MKLPPKLQRRKMGVRVPVQRVWPRHRRWVKAHRCCVPDCAALRVEFAHLRSAANSGKDQKPHDVFGVSLCRPHHDEQHRLGSNAFGRKYGIDLSAIASEFARESPDWKMRASLKLAPSSISAEGPSGVSPPPHDPAGPAHPRGEVSVNTPRGIP